MEKLQYPKNLLNGTVGQILITIPQEELKFIMYKYRVSINIKVIINKKNNMKSLGIY